MKKSESSEPTSSKDDDIFMVAIYAEVFLNKPKMPREKQVEAHFDEILDTLAKKDDKKWSFETTYGTKITKLSEGWSKAEFQNCLGQRKLAVDILQAIVFGFTSSNFSLWRFSSSSQQ